MNQADIDAARRLIAQFEDRALGRRNSSQLRENPMAPAPAPIPEQRHRVVVKAKPEECAVGEYCWMHGNYSPEVTIMRFLPPMKPDCYRSAVAAVPAVDYVVTWEFERVWLVVASDARQQRRQAWRRIA